MNKQETHKKAQYLVETLTPYQLAVMFIELKDEKEVLEKIVELLRGGVVV